MNRKRPLYLLIALVLSLMLIMTAFLTACSKGESEPEPLTAAEDANEAADEPTEEDSEEAQEEAADDADGTKSEAEAGSDDDATPDTDRSSEKILTFTTVDIDGNEISSEDIFSRSDYTMVNCWASWCGPCIQELPEIEALSSDFAERGGQVVGILMDGSTESGLSDAKEIIEMTGVSYLNVIDWAGIENQIRLVAYPTTFFVDSNGAVVGDVIVGADPEGYEKSMNGLLG